MRQVQQPQWKEQQARESPLQQLAGAPWPAEAQAPELAEAQERELRLAAAQGQVRAREQGG